LPVNIVMRFLQYARCVRSFSPLHFLSVLERKKLFTTAALQAKKIVISPPFIWLCCETKTGTKLMDLFNSTHEASVAQNNFRFLRINKFLFSVPWHHNESVGYKKILNIFTKHLSCNDWHINFLSVW
jgi:hypothetical protein